MYTGLRQTYSQEGIGVLWEAFRLAIRELIEYLPNIFLALTIVAIYVAIAIIVNNVLRRLFKLLRIDELLKPVIRQVYFSLTNMIILLVDIGLALLAVYSIITILFPHYIGYASTFLTYIGRVASVIFVIIVAFISLNIIVGYVRIETKLRGFMFMILLFITLILIVDITTLSIEVKTALAWGISIGIALMIAIFSIWYFFHEFIELRTHSPSQ